MLIKLNDIVPDEYLISELYYKYKFNVKALRIVDSSGKTLERREGHFLKINKESFLETLRRFFENPFDLIDKKAVYAVLHRLEKLGQIVF